MVTWAEEASRSMAIDLSAYIHTDLSHSPTRHNNGCNDNDDDDDDDDNDNG